VILENLSPKSKNKILLIFAVKLGYLFGKLKKLDLENLGFGVRYENSGIDTKTTYSDKSRRALNEYIIHSSIQGFSLGFAYFFENGGATIAGIESIDVCAPKYSIKCAWG